MVEGPLTRQAPAQLWERYRRRVTSAERRAISDEWRKVGEDALDAANRLLANDHFRSCVSRSYYAAYSFLAAALVLESGVNFRDDREGPEHEPLSDMVADHLRHVFPAAVRSRIRVGIRALYELRLIPDYRPRAVVGRARALDALRLASEIAGSVRKI